MNEANLKAPESLEKIKSAKMLILEHCKEIYREEVERHERINNSVKTYMAFQSFIVGILIFKAFPIHSLIVTAEKKVNLNIDLITLCVFSFSAVMFIMSFISTMLVVKVWQYERLKDPKKFVIDTDKADQLNVIHKILANYVVATDRNIKINDKKARLLSYAMTFLILSLILFLSGLLSFIAINNNII